jgi:hypothetical protein
MEVLMKGLMISAFAVVAVLAVMAAMRPRTPSVDVSLATATMPSLLELHTMAGVDKLPTQELEDHSLVYPAVATR